METSESIKELAGALSKAQGQMKNPVKNKNNPAFKGAKYADLAAIMDAIREPLSTNGLALVQAPSLDDAGQVRIVTRLMHASGEWLQESCSVPVATKSAQGIGSAITYGRRYAMSSLLGIAADDDDDANAASGKGGHEPTAPANPEPPKLDTTIVAQYEAVESMEQLANLWAATDDKLTYAGIKDQAKRRIASTKRAVAEQA